MPRLNNFFPALGVILLDGASKYFVKNYSNLRLVENQGLPFGIDFGSGFFNLSAAVLLLYIFCLLIFFGRRNLDPRGLALIVGGALANIFDRLDGSVMDFIPLGISTANFADFAIMGGIGLLLMSNVKAQMSK